MVASLQDDLHDHRALVLALYSPLPHWIRLTRVTTRDCGREGVWLRENINHCRFYLCLLNHSRWRKPVTTLWKQSGSFVERPIRGGAEASHQQPAPICYWASWEVNPPAPVQPLDDCTLVGILNAWDTEPKPSSQAAKFLTYRNGEIINVFCCFKSLNFGNMLCRSR